jgi:hypothetical protein
MQDHELSISLSRGKSIDNKGKAKKLFEAIFFNSYM